VSEKRTLAADQRKVVRDRKAGSRKWIDSVNKNIQDSYSAAKIDEERIKKLERQIV